MVYISCAFSFKRVKRVFYFFGFKPYFVFSLQAQYGDAFEYTFLLLPGMTVTNSSGPQTIIKTNHPASPVQETDSNHLPGGLMQLEAGLLN